MNRPYSEATVELVKRAAWKLWDDPDTRPEMPVYDGGLERILGAALDALAAADRLLPEGAETRTEWTAPPEPGPEVTAVRDKHGRRWERHAGTGLWCHTDDQLRHTHLYWDELFFSFPLTDATPVDAVRLAEGSKAFQDPSVCTYREIAETLTNVRKARRLSQRDVARLMGTESGASLCQWETGSKRARADHLEAWAGALGYRLVLMPVAAERWPAVDGRCQAVDPVWDRRCVLAEHEGVHRNDEIAGDTITWGTAAQVREFEGVSGV